MTSVAHKIIDALRWRDGDLSDHEYEKLDAVAVLVARAAKFIIPPAAIQKPLIETGREYLLENVWRPPFEFTLFEFHEGRGAMAALCLPNDALAGGYARDAATAVMGFVLTNAGEITVARARALIIHGPDFQIKMSSLDWDGKTPIGREAAGFMESVATAVVGAVPLLGAKGVATELVAAPDRLNKHRLKKGKVPLYEHRIIKIGGVSSSGRVVGVGMERASPRMHWRRGHVRTLPSGKKAAVRAALISQGSRGFISHEYEVAAHA